MPVDAHKKPYVTRKKIFEIENIPISDVVSPGQKTELKYRQKPQSCRFMNSTQVHHNLCYFTYHSQNTCSVRNPELWF